MTILKTMSSSMGRIILYMNGKEKYSKPPTSYSLQFQIFHIKMANSKNGGPIAWTKPPWDQMFVPSSGPKMWTKTEKKFPEGFWDQHVLPGLVSTFTSRLPGKIHHLLGKSTNFRLGHFQKLSLLVITRGYALQFSTIFFDSVFLQSLVGGIPTPLENDGLRQLGWWHSQLNGKSSNFIFPKHQPVYHFPISQYSVITILNR